MIFRPCMKYDWKINKTAGYHRHTFRLPIFVKRAFTKTITFFSRKNPSFFQLYKNFLIFCRKKLIIQRFLEIIPFDTHSTANLPPLAILKKLEFFSKKPSIFSKKKPQIFQRFRDSTILVAFYGECGTIS